MGEPGSASLDPSPFCQANSATKDDVHVLEVFSQSSSLPFTLCVLGASAQDFLPWVLPLESGRKPPNPVGSAKAHVCVGDDVDAAQPTSISRTALLGSCASFPSLSWGSEEAAAGT